MKFQNVLLFLLFFLVNYTDARVVCSNDRNCPDGYECDVDGEYCCQNSNCSLRSVWSTSRSECLVSGGGCPIHMFCHENGPHCTEKEIALCDLFLDAEKIVNCGAEGYPLALGFPTCSRMFYGREGINNEGHRTILCTAHCIQHWMSDLLYTNKCNCTEIEEKMSSYEMECLTECQFCQVPGSWDFYFNLFQLANRSELLIHKLASQCAKIYQHKKSDDFRKEIMLNAQSLQTKVMETLNVSIKDELNDLFQTTTTEATTTSAKPTTTSTESTTTQSFDEYEEDSTQIFTTPSSSKVYDYFYLGFNWPSGFFASTAAIIGFFIGFFVNYYCYPRIVYNVDVN